MITFSKLGSYGNLGNQLFQIAFITHFAEKYQLSYHLPQWEYAAYFNYPFHFSANLPSSFDLVLHEPTEVYNEDYFVQYLSEMRAQNVDIEGYLQSYKYFSKAHILKVFQPNEKFKPIQVNSDKCIAISVRRGDFVEHPLYNNIEAVTFIELLQHFRGFKVFVFSDDFNYCRKEFIGDQYEFMEGLSGIEQLLTMRLFDYFLLSNSTFSYWGAMLSTNPKKIYYPYYMFPSLRMCNMYNKDYWPTDNESYMFYINPLNKRYYV